MKIC
jgi:hypothetical protein